MADLRDITALILDDNAHMPELMKATLSAFGMRHIFEAADGAAAMAKLDLGDVDIAFVDLKHGSIGISAASNSAARFASGQKLKFGICL